MALSQVCTIDSCKRSARVLCICCQQNFCIIHLNEHSDLVNVRLTPLTHELNKRSNQFNNEYLLRSAFVSELDKWRQEAHEAVDPCYERKKQEFEEFFHSERDNQKIELNRLQNQINEFIREQETTQEDIDSMKKSIRSIRTSSIHSFATDRR